MAGTTAVVVGGGSGIGAAVAERQRAAGDTVITWDLADADVTCDITDAAAVADALAVTLERIGTPAQLTVTAGIGHSGLLEAVTPDEWDRVFGVNAKGVWLVLRAFAAPMRAAAAGSMVAVSSVSGRLVDRNMGLYCASKAALDMLVRVAAAEWAPEVRVNAVAPGVTDTPMLGRASRTGAWLGGVSDRTALGRLGTAADIAEAIVSMHSMQWVTGQVLECDGGLGLRSPIDAYSQLPKR